MPYSLGSLLSLLASASPLNNWNAGREPNAGDDTTAGYSKGSCWIDTSQSPAEKYILIDDTAGNAQWVFASYDYDDVNEGALFMGTINTAPTAIPATKKIYFNWKVNTSAGDVDLTPIAGGMTGLKDGDVVAFYNDGDNQLIINLPYTGNTESFCPGDLLTLQWDATNSIFLPQ